MWADHMLPWRKEFSIDTIMQVTTVVNLHKFALSECNLILTVFLFVTQVTMVCRVSSSRVCKSLCSKVTCSSNCTFIEYNFGFSRFVCLVAISRLSHSFLIFSDFQVI